MPKRKPLPTPPPPAAIEEKPVKQIKEIIIKVGIIEHSNIVSIGAEDDFEIIDMKTDEKIKMSVEPLKVSSKMVYHAKIVNGKIIFCKKQFSNDIKIIPKYSPRLSTRDGGINSSKKIGANDKKITVNGKKYRGNIIVKINNRKKLSVINELGIEEYICGVMTKEVSPDWSSESLKAQAVVARTYAIKNLEKHGSNGFDLCSKTHCQVYSGFDAEDERSSKAVYDTAGEILKYNGEIINALYHSSCGGKTSDVRNVWHSSKMENPKYLTGIKCGFCEKDKWYNWSAAISLKTIEYNLRSAGYNIGDVKKIKTVGHTSSDRVKQILVNHSKGELWLLSNRFRITMNPNIIRSTNFTIKIKNGIAYFRGHGWGHGVGMCQWGAKGMAEHDWNYKKILKHYYYGAEIINDEK